MQLQHFILIRNTINTILYYKYYKRNFCGVDWCSGRAPDSGSTG